MKLIVVCHKKEHMMNLIKKLKLPNQAIKILILLLSVDFFYILMYIISKVARALDIGVIIRDDAFNLSKDLGISESFQYAKEFWIILLFAWLIYKNRDFSYIGWSFLYIYLLLDDMLSIHERLGYLIIGNLGIFRQIGVNALIGVLFLSLIAISYLRGNTEIRTTFHYLIGGLLLLVFFGVGVDFVSDLFFPVETHKTLLLITNIFEDGGEMIAMSLMFWYVYTLTESALVAAKQ